MLHDSRLGGFKLEMNDNVSRDEADGIFLACKFYALRSDKKEKLKGKGIPEWLLSDAKESFKNRREYNGM
jgi:hypothetical protein